MDAASHKRPHSATGSTFELPAPLVLEISDEEAASSTTEAAGTDEAGSPPPSPSATPAPPLLPEPGVVSDPVGPPPPPEVKAEPMSVEAAAPA